MTRTTAQDFERKFSKQRRKNRKIRKLEYKTIHSFFVVLPPQSLECHAALATNAAFPGYVGHGSNATHATSGMHGANAAYAGYAYATNAANSATLSAESTYEPNGPSSSTLPVDEPSYTGYFLSCIQLTGSSRFSARAPEHTG